MVTEGAGGRKGAGAGDSLFLCLPGVAVSGDISRPRGPPSRPEQMTDRGHVMLNGVTGKAGGGTRMRRKAINKKRSVEPQVRVDAQCSDLGRT